nr:YdcF family protein [Microvirga terricola]
MLISLILLGLVVALFPRTRRLGIGLALAFALLTAACGLLPISSYIIIPLENRFPPFHDDDKPVNGIVLLGGSVEAAESVARGTLVTNESGERIIETIRLAHLYPQARILISGGGTVFGEGVAEAPIIAAFLTSVGVDASRIIIEDRSRTTYENAVFSRDIAKPKAGERWLLVTSAWHMPRSVGLFEKVGFPVIPSPVDYRTSGSFTNQRFFVFASEGLRRLDIGTKEWAGLVAYYLSGRIATLLPGP